MMHFNQRTIPSVDFELVSFLDSFINMFLFMVSGDSYANVVYGSVTNRSKAYFFLFAPMVLCGMFFMMTTLVGSFENTYGKYESTLRIGELRNKESTLMSMFVLWKPDEEDEKEDEDEFSGPEFSSDDFTQMCLVLQFFDFELHDQVAYLDFLKRRVGNKQTTLSEWSKEWVKDLNLTEKFLAETRDLINRIKESDIPELRKITANQPNSLKFNEKEIELMQTLLKHQEREEYLLDGDFVVDKSDALLKNIQNILTLRKDNDNNIKYREGRFSRKINNYTKDDDKLRQTEIHRRFLSIPMPDKIYKTMFILTDLNFNNSMDAVEFLQAYDIVSCLTTMHSHPVYSALVRAAYYEQMITDEESEENNDFKLHRSNAASDVTKEKAKLHMNVQWKPQCKECQGSGICSTCDSSRIICSTCDGSGITVYSIASESEIKMWLVIFCLAELLVMSIWASTAPSGIPTYTIKPWFFYEVQLDRLMALLNLVFIVDVTVNVVASSQYFSWLKPDWERRLWTEVLKSKTDWTPHTTYLFDLRPEDRFANRSNAIITMISFIGLVIYLRDGTLGSPVGGTVDVGFWRFVMTLTTWRILLLVPSFRVILFTFQLGLKSATPFFGLFTVVYYTFSLAAYCLFQDIQRDFDADPGRHYNDFVTSLWVLFNLFIGDWNDIVAPMVRQTNKDTIWFYICYIIIVGILFVNLIVGIILNMYDTAENRMSTFTGKSQIILERYLGNLTDDDAKLIVKTVGFIEHNIQLAQPEKRGPGTKAASSVGALKSVEAIDVEDKEANKTSQMVLGVLNAGLSGVVRSKKNEQRREAILIIQKFAKRMQALSQASSLADSRAFLHNPAVGLSYRKVMSALYETAQCIDFAVNRRDTGPGLIRGVEAIKFGVRLVIAKLSLKVDINETIWIDYKIAQLLTGKSQESSGRWVCESELCVGANEYTVNEPDATTCKSCCSQKPNKTRPMEMGYTQFVVWVMANVVCADERYNRENWSAKGVRITYKSCHTDFKFNQDQEHHTSNKYNVVFDPAENKYIREKREGEMLGEIPIDVSAQNADSAHVALSVVDDAPPVIN